MSKCPVCHSRKGKRRCLIEETPVCSLCCGKTRSESLCLACQYYQKPIRKYGDVPAYSVADMDKSSLLESFGEVIEGGLCEYDTKIGGTLRDADAIRIIELLINVYHFGDTEIDESNHTILDGFNYVRSLVESVLDGVDDTVITKILGIIHFVARRRTMAGGEYMTTIHRYH